MRLIWFGRLFREGETTFCKMSLSRVLESMEVTDIGHMSDGETGFCIFGMGWIIAFLHCEGTVPAFKDKLYKYVNDLLMTGANSLINQKGIPSYPEEVAVRWSSKLKTSYSFNILFVLRN